MSIPQEWQRVVQSGEVQLVDTPKPEVPDYQTPEYQEFLAEMAKHCKCCPEICPCDGVLAGGLCDRMECGRCRRDDKDWQEDLDE